MDGNKHPTYKALSHYTIMWLLVCFDLPTDTKIQRRNAAIFRKNLLKDGFSMMQFSVYIRHCATHESMDVHIQTVRTMIPPEGLVSIIRITDKQFGDTITLCGRKSVPPPTTYTQLELF